MLALDPYYEMFPSSYQRPYPYWYGLGATPSLDELDHQRNLLQFLRGHLAARPSSVIFVDNNTAETTINGEISAGLLVGVNEGLATAGISPLRPRALTVEETFSHPGVTGALAQGFILIPQLDVAIAVLSQKITQLEAALKVASPATAKTATSAVKAPTVSRSPSVSTFAPSVPTATAVLPTKPLSNGAKIAIGAGIGVAILGIGVLLFGR